MLPRVRQVLTAAAELARAASEPGPFDPDRLDGRDPELLDRLLPALELLNRHYLRLRVSGTEHLRRGPCVYVGNHNGGIMGPDLACTLGTLLGELGTDTPLYAMAHDFAMRQLTPLGRVLQRLGAVRAAPENAERVLASGGQVLVYPGGDLDAYRSFFDRDRIVFGTRTGFVRVAQRAGVPLVPIVAHGAHRSAIIVTDGARLAERIALPRWGRLGRFPIALALPWGIALGPWTPYLPLPFPIRLRVLEPIHVATDEDPAVVRERVRQRMQAALDELAAGSP